MGGCTENENTLQLNHHRYVLGRIRPSRWSGLCLNTILLGVVWTMVKGQPRRHLSETIWLLPNQPWVLTSVSTWCGTVIFITFFKCQKQISGWNIDFLNVWKIKFKTQCKLDRKKKLGDLIGSITDQSVTCVKNYSFPEYRFLTQVVLGDVGKHIGRWNLKQWDRAKETSLPSSSFLSLYQSECYLRKFR